MAFNLDKAIAGMSFGFPSSERIDETVGIILCYPATPEGHALLSVYTFELQMSWPRLYIEALLLLQRNAFVEEAAKTDSIRTLQKRKYDNNYREANNVKKVIDGSRDQMLGFDHKGRVSAVQMTYCGVPCNYVLKLRLAPRQHPHRFRWMKIPSVTRYVLKLLLPRLRPYR